VHLQFVAGYDEADLRLGLWGAEAVTDGYGRASLPNSLKNFSFVEVWVAKRKLCTPHGHSSGVILDRVRSEGLSAPNHCGTTVVEDTPGVLNVFAKAQSRDLLAPPAPRTPKTACTLRRHKKPGPGHIIGMAAIGAGFSEPRAVSK
jgi:hypothetical protein